MVSTHTHKYPQINPQRYIRYANWPIYSAIFAARYNQHLSPISRSANAQTDHHRHTAHAITTHQHLHPLQQHFDTSDVNKISQSSSNCGGSDTDLTAVDDDSNVLNLSRRRSSDTTNSNNNSNNGKC